MRSCPSVFLDTSVLKASVDTRLAFVPESKQLQWGGQQFETEVHRPVFVNPNVKFLRSGRANRYQDTVALRFVAALAREGKIRLVCHKEAFLELMRLPRVNGQGPRFYGAPIREVDGPIQYGRVVADWSRRDWQFEFLATLKDPRFLELQRACGAFQGHDRPPHRNQLIDAFHLLCAESADATFFLALDDALIRALANHKTHKVGVNCITPKRLLVTLISSHPTWIWSVLKEAWRIGRSERRLDQSVQDASREFWA